MECKPGNRTKWQKVRPFFLLALAVFLLVGMLDEPALRGCTVLISCDSSRSGY